MTCDLMGGGLICCAEQGPGVPWFRDTFFRTHLKQRAWTWFWTVTKAKGGIGREWRPQTCRQACWERWQHQPGRDEEQDGAGVRDWGVTTGDPHITTTTPTMQSMILSHIYTKR